MAALGNLYSPSAPRFQPTSTSTSSERTKAPWGMSGTTFILLTVIVIIALVFIFMSAYSSPKQSTTVVTREPSNSPQTIPMSFMSPKVAMATATPNTSSSSPSSSSSPPPSSSSSYTPPTPFQFKMGGVLETSTNAADTNLNLGWQNMSEAYMYFVFPDDTGENFLMPRREKGGLAELTDKATMAGVQPLLVIGCPKSVDVTTTPLFTIDNDVQTAPKAKTASETWRYIISDEQGMRRFMAGVANVCKKVNAAGVLIAPDHEAIPSPDAFSRFILALTTEVSARIVISLPNDRLNLARYDLPTLFRFKRLHFIVESCNYNAGGVTKHISSYQDTKDLFGLLSSVDHYHGAQFTMLLTPQSRVFPVNRDTYLKVLESGAPDGVPILPDDTLEELKGVLVPGTDTIDMFNLSAIPNVRTVINDEKSGVWYLAGDENKAYLVSVPSESGLRRLLNVAKSFGVKSVLLQNWPRLSTNALRMVGIINTVNGELFADDGPVRPPPNEDAILEQLAASASTSVPTKRSKRSSLFTKPQK